MSAIKVWYAPRGVRVFFFEMSTNSLSIPLLTILKALLEMQ